jgi:methyltransferase family protein
MHSIRRRLKTRHGVRNIYFVATDLRRGMEMVRGIHDTTSGTPHAARDVDESLAYITEVFADYKRYGRIERFQGRAAEIGAGDSCGVAMLLRADGCDQVDLPDRFAPQRDTVRQARIYEALWAQHPDLRAVLGHPDPADERSFAGITRYTGPAGAAERFFDDHRGYEHIVSRSVLEHVVDPGEALRSMAASLAPGGRMTHKVDLRDHGLYTPYGHELAFLEVSDRLYRHMNRWSGRPNRHRLDTYRSALDAAGVDYEILVTRLVGVGDIEPHVPYGSIEPRLRETSARFVEGVRARLAKRFRSRSTEDLSIAGFFLVARDVGERPASPSSAAGLAD